MILWLSLFSWSVHAQSGQVRASKDSVTFHDSILDQPSPVSTTIAQDLGLKIADVRADQNKTDLFLLFLLIFLLFGLLRFFYPKYISGLFKLYNRGQMVNQSAIHQLQSNNAPKVLFTIIYFLTAGYVVVKIIYYFQGMPLCTNSCKDIGLGISLITATFLFKFIIVRALSWIFNFKKGIKGLFHYLNFANQIVGIILLPICGLLLLCLEKGATFILILGIITLAISLIVRYIYNFAYLKQLPNVRLIHFLLYLCAFEIIPIAVLGRYLLNNFA